MMVTFVSQCEKKALPRTRRVLDAFADRIGDNTWQTVITLEGLNAVRKLLRKTSSKSTAVSCHWIRSRSRTELVWVVGKRAKFDLQGRIPVNRTRNTTIKTEMDISWNTAGVIALLAGIAGLFHDVGKANILFQRKLLGGSKQGFEPYRHEWVSLRVFEAFVKSSGKMDQEWLHKLSVVLPEDEKIILSVLEKDNLPEDKKNRVKRKRPFVDMPPVAQAVAWLIVSHHRLPKYIPTKDGDNYCPPFDHVDRWLNDFYGWYWNSRNAESEKIKTATVFKKNWEFKNGTPVRSHTWCNKAHELAKRALGNPLLLTSNQLWLADHFTSHIARLVLMLSDHVYSAGGATPKWQDEAYACYANTDKQTRERKQRLDEHNIGVAQNAYLLAKGLSSLRRSLPSLARVKGLESKTAIKRFRWQNQAFDLATSLKSPAREHGFFGINMASTGCGKTLANARIMYALADTRLGYRVSIALGLRILTQQTGDALMSMLGLADDDIATLIGSQAIKQLREFHQQSPETPWESAGSASAEELVDTGQVIRYEGEIYDGRLKQWLGESSRLNQLLSAPILVSTIDYLMPATEGERGGKQIAPMLRLLTSDLILDEPDDFDQADIPALCRLVNWAGMLGSNVLISSATLPPSEVAGLFDAYLAGRAHYNRACGTPRANIVNCAWFDETLKPEASAISDLQSFRQQHASFVDRRCKKLAALPIRRRAALLNVNHRSCEHEDVVTSIGAAIAEGIDILHQRHHIAQPNADKKVSIGLVRMANINPLVAVAQYLLQQPPKENCHIHFCIYHSRHPLIVRSRMEHILDSTLSRHDENAFWRQPSITNALSAYPEGHHIFVVFATAVAEVGRDHDYDWAIVEPSSMRSVIQLAGRVWRHRDKTCEQPNILILNQNYRSLRGERIAYTMPGFESRQFPLDTHELSTLLEPQALHSISAIPRIQVPEQLNAKTNLIHLEHASLEAAVFGVTDLIPHYAARWWQQPLSWNAELQKHTRFRQSRPDDKLVLLMEDEQDELEIFIDFEDGTEPKKATLTVEPDRQYPERITPWLDLNVTSLLADIVENQEVSWRTASRVFTEMRVDQNQGEFKYAPDFGVYRTLR